ncbi:hypothetical protein BC826DRAFT_967823 [Russula brevipes]|nr:hypothetical protein BC826DRAFT_967823 [Russula brevipes]
MGGPVRAVEPSDCRITAYREGIAERKISGLVPFREHFPHGINCANRIRVRLSALPNGGRATRGLLTGHRVMIFTNNTNTKSADAPRRLADHLVVPFFEGRATPKARNFAPKQLSSTYLGSNEIPGTLDNRNFRCAFIAADSVYICHRFRQAPPESRPRGKMDR